MARQLLGLFYFLSGFAFLSIETLWIREAGLHIGNTVVSATLVVAIYFVCAAIGNLAGAASLRRGASAVALYAIAELATGLAAGAAYALRHVIGALVLVQTAPLAHVVYIALLIALPSIFSGAAFAALTDAGIRAIGERTGTGGVLYAGNLVGGALGVLIGGIAIPMAAGNPGAFYTAACLEILIGLGVLLLRPLLASDPAAESSVPAPDEPGVRVGPGLAWTLIALSGAASIALEILAVAYLRQVYQDSLYTASAALFAFIVDMGLGSMLAALLRRRRLGPEPLLVAALLASGIFALLWPAEFYLLRPALTDPSYGSLGQFIGDMVGVATLAAGPLLIPVGMVFPLAWELLDRENTRQGAAIGRMSSLNKLCCAFGAALVPFVLLGRIGMNGTALLAGFVYAFAGLAVVLAWSGPRRALVVAACLVALCAYPAYHFRITPLQLVKGSHAEAIYEGADGVVAVTVDPEGSHHIVVNQNYTLNGTERALTSQRDESWIPLAMSPNPKRIAFIGMASGVSAAAALDFPIEHLDAIEINPQVVRAARERFAPWSGRLFHDSRAQIVVGDGRYVLQTARRPYDTVICTLMLPSQEGTSALYSSDFFAAVRAKLTRNGLFCLWLPTYQHNIALAGMVVNTFAKAFPYAVVVRGNFSPDQPIAGLIGSPSPIDLSTSFLSRRLASTEVGRIAAESPFLHSVDNFRLTLIGDLACQRDYFAGFGVTNDDYPSFAFEGPRPIGNGDYLLGLPLLNWLGRRFLDPVYPSCKLDVGDPAMVMSGLRAGNYYYASSVYSFHRADDIDAQLRQQQEADNTWRTAQSLSPRSVLRSGDLGR